MFVGVCTEKNTFSYILENKICLTFDLFWLKNCNNCNLDIAFSHITIMIILQSTLQPYFAPLNTILYQW